MKRKIALMGQERIDWTRLRGSAAQKVNSAIKKGLLPNLKKQEISCVDCRNRATMYHHEDYTKALEVDPVCGSCNIVRGTNAPILPQDSSKPTCPKCGAKQTLYRVRNDELLCRVCGNVFKRKEPNGKQKI